MSDGLVQQRSHPQCLDTFCTKLKVGWKQQLSISLDATVQMGDNVFLGTPEFPGLPTSGPATSTAATSVVMQVTPLLESVAKGGGKDLDKLMGKWSSSDSSQVPLKKPQGDSLALRVSFADTSGLTLSTQHSGRLLSSLLTSQYLLTQLGMQPLAGHSSSGTSVPPQTPGNLKAQDEMCNEVTQLWVAYQDWIQGAFQFQDKEIVARMELITDNFIDLI